VEVLCKLSSLQ
jgi:hypothetical protein